MCAPFLRFPAMEGGRHIKSDCFPRVPINPETRPCCDLDLPPQPIRLVRGQ